MTATATIAAIGNGAAFKKGRGFAAWLGVVPGEHSTGGKQKLTETSRRGNRYLRKLFVQGAHAVLQSENETIFRPEARGWQSSPPASAFRWRRWRWPTRWRAWPGRCSPKAKPIALRFDRKCSLTGLQMTPGKRQAWKSLRDSHITDQRRRLIRV